MDIIIFQIDENGNWIQDKPNLYGEYAEDNSDGNIWIHIYDEAKNEIYLSRGTRICFGGDDLYKSCNYIIKEAQMSMYRVEEI